MKLYNHLKLDPDAGLQQLLNEVQFHIRFYLCRRGAESFLSMDEDTFKLEYDIEAKISFVRKVKDKLTKNHKDKNTEVTTGFMPQVFGPNGQPHKICPVRSFENYISHLSPKCN